MKNLIYPIVALLFTLNVNAQNVGINDDGSSPHASAMLDVKSIDKGLLIPRVDTMSIVNPAAGLMTFQVLDSSFYFFNGDHWELLGNSPSKIEDVDMDTRVETEVNPDEDLIRFYVDGIQKFQMDTMSLQFLNTNNNTNVGRFAGTAIATGENNSYYGRNAGRNTIDGHGNVALGYNSLYDNSSGSFNTAVGMSTLSNNNWTYNVAMGYTALLSNETGGNNTAVGALALRTDTTGFDNTAIGSRAMNFHRNGDLNTAVGYSSLAIGENGELNAAIGSFSLSNSQGDENSALGSYAGHLLEDGERNIFIGAGTGPEVAASFDDRLYIDVMRTDMPLIYGNFATDEITIHGDLNVTDSLMLPLGAEDGYIAISDSVGGVHWTAPEDVVLPDVTSLRDMDSDTSIEVEEASDEDVIRFKVKANEVMSMTAEKSSLSLSQQSGSFNGSGSSSHWQSIEAPKTGHITRFDYFFKTLFDSSEYVLNVYTGQGTMGNLIATKTETTASTTTPQYFGWDSLEVIVFEDSIYTFEVSRIKNGLSLFTNVISSNANPYTNGRSHISATNDSKFLMYMNDGCIIAHSDFIINSDLKLPSGAQSGYVITSDNDGNMSWSDPSGINTSWNSLLNIPADFSDDIDNVEDADSDPQNELSDLTLTDNILKLSNPLTPANEIDLSSFQKWECNGDTLFHLDGPVGIGDAEPVNLLDMYADTEATMTIRSKQDVNLRLLADVNNLGEIDNPMITMLQDGGLVGVYLGFEQDSIGNNIFAIGTRNNMETNVWNAFTINTQTNNIGMGISSADADLHIKDDEDGASLILESTKDAILTIKGNSDSLFPISGPGENSKLIIEENGFGDGVHIGYDMDSIGFSKFIIATEDNNIMDWDRFVMNAFTGNTGIQQANPNEMFQVDQATCNGLVWSNASDRRLKKDIKVLKYGIDEIMKMNPVKYRYKRNDKADIGFIAQEVREIIPEVISGKEGDIEKGESLGITYGSLTALLVKGMQEQQEHIETLIKKNKFLEERLSKIEAMLDK